MTITTKPQAKWYTEQYCTFYAGLYLPGIMRHCLLPFVVSSWRYLCVTITTPNFSHDPHGKRLQGQCLLASLYSFTSSPPLYVIVELHSCTPYCGVPASPISPCSATSGLQEQRSALSRHDNSLMSQRREEVCSLPPRPALWCLTGNRLLERRKSQSSRTLLPHLTARHPTACRQLYPV